MVYAWFSPKTYAVLHGKSDEAEPRREVSHLTSMIRLQLLRHPSRLNAHVGAGGNEARDDGRVYRAGAEEQE